VWHNACRDGAEVLEDVANVERFGQRWKKRVKGIELVEIGLGLSNHRHTFFVRRCSREIGSRSLRTTMTLVRI
jgi:hypothetical protein